MKRQILSKGGLPCVCSTTCSTIDNYVFIRLGTAEGGTFLSSASGPQGQHCPTDGKCSKVVGWWTEGRRKCTWVTNGIRLVSGQLAIQDRLYNLESWTRWLQLNHMVKICLKQGELVLRPEADILQTNTLDGTEANSARKARKCYSIHLRMGIIVGFPECGSRRANDRSYRFSITPSCPLHALCG